MPRLLVLTPVAGDPSWHASEVVEVDDDVYEAWCDGVRAAPADLDGAEEDDVLALVDEHPGRAAYALERERARTDGPRPDLVAALDQVLADAQARAEAEAATAQVSDEVPTNVDDVKAWVGADPVRAGTALQVERNRDGGPRKTLEPWLEELAIQPPSQD